MRPRIQITRPEPKGSEFENFDRLMGILVHAKPPKKKVAAKRKRLARRTRQKSEALTLPLAPSLPGALNPLLRLLGRKPIPCEPTTCSVRKHEGEPLRISHPASVVTEALLIQIAEQMKRFHADVRAMKLAFNQTPEVLHGVGVHVAPRILYGVVYDRALIFRIQAIIRLQRVAVGARNRLERSRVLSRGVHACDESIQRMCERFRPALPFPGQ